jgi:hypothetical protein
MSLVWMNADRESLERELAAVGWFWRALGWLALKLWRVR